MCAVQYEAIFNTKYWTVRDEPP